MSIIIALIFASALIWLVYRWKFFKKSMFRPQTFAWLLFLKLTFGVCFYLVYTVYYTNSQTSDMHKYFNDAVKIFELTQHKPLSYLSILTGVDMNSEDEIVTQQLNFWYQEESASVINDSRMIIRFNLLLMPFTKGNIYLHLVSIVFISFAGLFLIYTSMEKFFIKREFLLLLACFGVPSVMFWSSGILKEGILIFFFGMLIYSLFKMQSISVKRSMLIFISFFGMFFTKFYVALALVPSLLFLFNGFIFKKNTNTINLIITGIIGITAAMSFNFLLHNLPLEKLSKKQNDFINLSLGGVYLANTNAPFDTIFTLKSNSLIYSQKLSVGEKAQLKTGTVYHHWKNPGYADTLVAPHSNVEYTILKVLEPTGSAISLKRLMPTYGSVLSLFPEAFINVCFRPFIYDVENFFSLLACLENLMFMILILALILVYKKPAFEAYKVILFSLLFVFTLYTLVGLTTPVLGAAVRYKVPAIPFLLISLFLFYDYSKLQKLFKKRS